MIVATQMLLLSCHENMLKEMQKVCSVFACLFSLSKSQPNMWQSLCRAQHCASCLGNFTSIFLNEFPFLAGSNVRLYQTKLLASRSILGICKTFESIAFVANLTHSHLAMLMFFHHEIWYCTTNISIFVHSQRVGRVDFEHILSVIPSCHDTLLGLFPTFDGIRLDVLHFADGVCVIGTITSSFFLQAFKA